MDIINIRKDGFYINEEDEKIDDISFYLNNIVRIEDGVTLENIFDFLIKHEAQVNLLFNSWLGGFGLNSYYKELKGSPKKDESFIEGDDDEILFIKISWVADYVEWEDDDCKKQSEILDYIHINGVSPKYDYSLGFSPLYHLKDLSIVMDHKYEIFKEYVKGAIPIISTHKEMALYDVIGTILYEVSFYGTPEDRNVAVEKIAEEIINHKESGEDQYVSVDSLMLEFLEKDLERLIGDEKYERASKVQKEINRHKKKIESEGIEDKKSEE